MNSAFAHSSAMQCLLMGITFATTFINMYLITKLIKAVYYEPIDVKRSSVLTMLTGALLVSGWTYGVYLIGGRISMPPAVYHAVGTVNPLFSLLYYYIGVKAMGLPASHSVRLMGHVNLYYMLNTAIRRLASVAFFAHNPAWPHNYLIDIVNELVSLGIVILMFEAVLLYQRRTGFYISLSDKASPNIRRDVLLYVMRVTFSYELAVTVLLVLKEQVMANVLLAVIYALLLALDIQIDVRKAMRARLENKKAHVNALQSSMEAFSQVKHDFYNILQTYQGYISMGDLDRLKRYHATLVDSTLSAGNSMSLNARMDEQPVLAQLLQSRMDTAQQVGVKMYIDIQSGLGDLYMDIHDLCTVAGNLLDNAIQAAQRSEAKHVFFSLDRKAPEERLITITNSTARPFDYSMLRWPGVSGKPIVPKTGLTQVREVLLRYANYTFHGAYYDKEFSAYLALRPPTAGSS